MTQVEYESMTLPSSVLKRFINKTFVETGSYDGRTIQQALDCGFQDVRSVELSITLHTQCQLRFGSNPKVKLFCGDSYQMLPYMLKDLDWPATFWLDAHIQEGVHGKFYAPILQELNMISYHPLHTHTIMIDDRRLMGQGSWATISEKQIINILTDINRDYIIEAFDSKAAKDDILVAHL